MLHTMERLERRQLRLRTRSPRKLGPRDVLRTRAIALAAVWLSVAIVLLAGGRDMSAGMTTTAGTLLIGFWGGWTLWILRMLRRLVTS